MKLKELLFILTIGLIGLGFVLINNKINKTNKEQVEINKNLMTLVVDQQKQILNLAVEVDSINTELQSICDTHYEDVLSIKEDLNKLTKEVDNNTMMSEVWGEDIYRLHVWYWESDEAKRKLNK